MGGSLAGCSAEGIRLAYLRFPLWGGMAVIEASSDELEELAQLVETRLSSLRMRTNLGREQSTVPTSNTLLLLEDLLDRRMVGSCPRAEE